MKYKITITEGKNKGKVFLVDGASIEDAAKNALRKVSRTAKTAIRVTGDSGKSGLWQGYKAVRTGGLTSDGPNYHVGPSNV